MPREYPWLDRSEGGDWNIYDSGWKALIDEMLAEIDAAFSNTNATLIALQIKEKFGSLRFYYRLEKASAPQQAAIQAIVDRAYARSRVTCLYCSEPGSIQDVSGWFVCLCDDHAKVADTLDRL